MDLRPRSRMVSWNVDCQAGSSDRDCHPGGADVSWVRSFAAKGGTAVWLLHLNKKTMGAILLAGAFLAAPTRRVDIDHIGAYNVSVEISRQTIGSFKGLGGLSVEMEVIESQDDGDLIVRKRPGRVTYGDITLTKGRINADIAIPWRESVISGEVERKDIGIVLRDDADQEIARWNCFRCFPKSWKVSSFAGKGNDVLTEEVVIVVEYFDEA